MIGLGIVEGLLTEGILCLCSVKGGIRIRAFALWHQSKEVRISFSTLLRIRNGERYLLIRNRHKQEQFGPIGGANKYYNVAMRFLDSISFRPQVVAEEMERDMRGFLPSKNLPKLVAWYQQRQDCESAETCLRREIREELCEVGLASVCVPDDISFHLVRTVWEGPQFVPGTDYDQFRFFQICDIRAGPSSSEKFLKSLWLEGETHQGLLVVSPPELIYGRARNGAVIGPLSEYLFRSRLGRPDGPSFAAPVW